MLNELAAASKVGIEFDESKVPMRPEVNAACEMLGLDPFYVANEGKLVAIVPPNRPSHFWPPCAPPVWQRRRHHRQGGGGTSRPGDRKTSIGGMRVVDVPAGELLPRIC